ncbi:MAG: hypothetical protein HZA79_17035 [Sphingobacteriales bacterium]|nr:hypothetical protein [Sphingobacteriales bacterium]
MKLALILFSAFLLLQAATVLYVIPAWKRAAVSFRPMLIFMVVYFILELVQAFVPGKPFVRVSTTNVQYLTSLLLVIWQAKQWHVFDRRPRLFRAWLLTAIGCWIPELYFIDPGEIHVTWYFTTCALMITLMAIEMLNSNITRTRVPFFKNPVFLFCTGLIFSFTLWGVMDLFTISLLNSNQANLVQSYYLYISLGILTQVLFLRSVWCIPAKENYVPFE